MTKELEWDGWVDKMDHTPKTLTTVRGGAKNRGTSSGLVTCRLRGERYIETIASLDQWSITIENH